MKCLVFDAGRKEYKARMSYCDTLNSPVSRLRHAGLYIFWRES